MSDLEEIAAEAHIVIVDTDTVPNDSGDCLNNATPLSSNVQEVDASGDPGDAHSIQALEALFHHRYTDMDPEYLKTVEEAEVSSKPPCVQDFFVRRPRDDNRNWNRFRGSHHRGGGGDRGRYRSPEGSYNDRYRHSNHGGWAGGDNRAWNQNRDRGYNTHRRDRNDDYTGHRRDRSSHR